MTADAFFPAGKAHFFRGRRLDIDPVAAGLTGIGQGFAHGIHVGRQFRGLADDGDIGIGNGKPLVEGQLHDLFAAGKWSKYP